MFLLCSRDFTSDSWLFCSSLWHRLVSRTVTAHFKGQDVKLLRQAPPSPYLFWRTFGAHGLSGILFFSCWHKCRDDEIIQPTNLSGEFDSRVLVAHTIITYMTNSRQAWCLGSGVPEPHLHSSCRPSFKNRFQLTLIRCLRWPRSFLLCVGV